MNSCRQVRGQPTGPTLTNPCLSATLCASSRSTSLRKRTRKELLKTSDDRAHCHRTDSTSRSSLPGRGIVGLLCWCWRRWPTPPTPARDADVTCHRFFRFRIVVYITWVRFVLRAFRLFWWSGRSVRLRDNRVKTVDLTFSGCRIKTLLNSRVLPGVCEIIWSTMLRS